MSSAPTARRSASAWCRATSSPTTSRRRRTTCTWRPRSCDSARIGPELVVGGDFASCAGRHSHPARQRNRLAGGLASGEADMCHSLANLEHHHFKYDQHRRPGDVHVHFFGADHFSFRDRVRLQDGDVMAVSFTGFGRPLRNPVRDRSLAAGLRSPRGRYERIDSARPPSTWRCSPLYMVVTIVAVLGFRRRRAASQDGQGLFSRATGSCPGMSSGRA